MLRREFLAVTAAGSQLSPQSLTRPARGKIRAGAAAANINADIGGSLAGNFTEARSRNIHDDLHAKSLVLDNGSTRLAMVLVDLCVLPASVNVAAKQIIASEAGVPYGNALFCCT